MSRRQVKPLNDLKGISRSTFLTNASLTHPTGFVSQNPQLEKEFLSANVSPAEGAMGMGDVLRRRTPRLEKIMKGSSASELAVKATDDEFRPIRIDVSQVDPYLAAISRTDFNPVAFTTELFLHYFQPFVTLFAFDARVRVVCRNRHFIYGGSILVTIMQIGLMICLLVVNIIALVDNRTFSWIQLAIFNISTFLRYIVIAIKYAVLHVSHRIRRNPHQSNPLS
ncbi:hypothetical protein BC829DRAFT_232986 [Chytridium lagenaria]|nr:hypothetical protein BC829DRAFT_232986 [Chytridium lagenaria]